MWTVASEKEIMNNDHWGDHIMNNDHWGDHGLGEVTGKGKIHRVKYGKCMWTEVFVEGQIHEA
jgi:hypothetical protein